jgi:methionyl-tRNA formyltransferase
VALTAPEPILAQDTFGTLSPRLAELGARLLIEALDLGLDDLRFTEQDEIGVTYAEKIAPGDRILDPTEAASDLERRVRALTPHVGAAVLTGDGERLGVLAATARTAIAGDPPPSELSYAGGEVLLGCAGETTLRLDIVQPPGRRAMDAAAFLRGRGG